MEVFDKLDKFESVSYTVIGKDESVDDRLSEYHHKEEYDPNKEYTKEPYEHDYGATGVGTRTYVDCLYELRRELPRIDDDLPECEELMYVVANEKLSAEEKEKLAAYCQCAYHQMYWFNPIKYFTCACCVGCLQTPNYQQYVINTTRKHMENN